MRSGKRGSVANPTVDRFWIMPGWIFLVSALIFAGLAMIARGSDLVPGDETVTDEIQELNGQPWLAFADIGNAYGATPTIPIALLGLTFVAWRRRSHQIVVFCTVLLVLRMLAMFLKEAFDSPRPTVDVAELHADFDGLGFPSGHASTAMIVAGALTVVLIRLFPEAGWLKPAIALAWFMALITGYARIWYGAHWTTDVLGGYAVGAVMLGISSYAAAWSRRYLPTT
jgi:undecaprenyl-diphosphatase